MVITIMPYNRLFFLFFFITTLIQPLNGEEPSQVDLYTSKVPLCMKSEYKDGEWVLKKHHRSINIKKSFYCCPTSGDMNLLNDDNRICDNEEEGSHVCWYTKGNPLYSTSVGRGCSCDINLGRHQSHIRERYLWQPHNCRLLEWNATQFCNLLGDRNISMIGDSTMEQTAATLVYNEMKSILILLF